MVRKLLVFMLAAAFLAGGPVMLTSCAKKQMKEEPSLISADDKARREAEERAKMERERMDRERAIREQKLREQQSSLKEQFENKKVYFAYDSAALSGDAQNVLRDKAEFLKKNADKNVLVEGNCDERGSVEYNLALGQRRAEEAKKYLTLMGVGADRIKTISYGKERPLDPAHNEEAWAKNRRDEFVLQD